MKRQRWRVSDPVMLVVWTVLLGSRSYPYWKGGITALAAACGALSRRQIRRALILLAKEGFIILKADRRGRGRYIHPGSHLKSGQMFSEHPPTPPSIRKGVRPKDGVVVKDTPRRLLGEPPEAYSWKGVAMKWFRTQLRHRLITGLVGHWIFHRDLTKEWARAIMWSLHQSKLWLFSLEFASPRQAWGFFVWLLRWCVQRWLMTGRHHAAEEVWHYAIEAGRPADVRV